LGQQVILHTGLSLAYERSGAASLWCAAHALMPLQRVHALLSSVQFTIVYAVVVLLIYGL
jgi:hypothetical protein